MQYQVHPSRLLNEQRTVMGLYVSDFGAAFSVFAILSKILETTPYGYLAIVGAISSLVVIAPVRLSLRKHIIRDSLSFLLMRSDLFNPKEVIKDGR